MTFIHCSLVHSVRIYALSMLALYSTPFDSHVVSEHASFHRVLEVFLFFVFLLFLNAIGESG